MREALRTPGLISTCCLLAAGLCILTTACSEKLTDRRDANPLEYAYSFLAARLRMPEICEKISPRAKLSAGWGGEGFEIAYTRSQCYYNLALETGDPEYCVEVIEAEHLFLDGSHFTEDHCRKAVLTSHGISGIGGDPEWVARFIGFTEGDLGPGDWNRLFHDITLDGKHRERATLLPDFSADNGRVVTALKYSDLGCSSDDDHAWYCYAYRCLDSGNEEVREACLEVAQYLQVQQREQAQGGTFRPSKHVEGLLKKYPGLKTFTTSP